MFSARRFYRKIRRLLEWAAILWYDEDWDWSCVLDIWAYKLQRTRLCILNNRIIADAQETHDSIKVCEDALRRMALDEYAEKERFDHRARFPRRLDFLESGKRVRPPMSKEEHENFMAITTLEDERRATDIDLFCKTFAEHYRSWWD